MYVWNYLRDVTLREKAVADGSLQLAGADQGFFVRGGADHLGTCEHTICQNAKKTAGNRKGIWFAWGFMRHLPSLPIQSASGIYESLVGMAVGRAVEGMQPPAKSDSAQH